MSMSILIIVCVNFKSMTSCQKHVINVKSSLSFVQPSIEPKSSNPWDNYMFGDPTQAKLKKLRTGCFVWEFVFDIFVENMLFCFESGGIFTNIAHCNCNIALVFSQSRISRFAEIVFTMF